jgi:5,10-methylenetetrahydromethanopterin reductase
MNKPVATVRDSVNVIRSLLEGKEVTFKSSAFELKGIAFSKTQRRVPIYLAARSEQLMSLVGEVADGEILNCAPSARYIKWARSMIDKGARKSRRSPAKIEIMGIPDLSLGKSSRIAVENARMMVARRIAYHPEPVAKMLGIKADDYVQINSAVRADKMDRAAKLVDEDMIGRVAIAGDAEDVIEKCVHVAKAGVTELAFPLRTRGKETLKHLLERVIPALRKEL